MSRAPVAAIGFILLATLACGVATAGASKKGKAPAFTLDTLSGERVTLSDALADGPVVLDFWATWCAPCRRALPHLQALSDKYSDRGLSVLLINQDDPRNEPKIAAAVRSLGLDLPVLMDRDRRIARLYQVTALPATFVISATGEVIAYHRGYHDGDQEILAAEVESLLAATAAEEAAP